MRKRYLSLLLPLLCIQSLSAQIYVATGDVNLRADYPKFPFYKNAAVIGVVKKGDSVTLLDRKDVFVYEWLKVQTVKERKTGWVYNGKSGDKPYFILLEGRR